jgi:7-carboxy-7-deazaguanine synthase
VANLIPVMEIFGPTVQGEGRMIGRKTMFLRTGGCDYKCSWCDSKFTWDGSEKATMMTPQEVLDSIVSISGGEQLILATGQIALNFNHVTISGGNPALIGSAMSEFIELCASHNIHVGVETQGSKWQEWFYDVDDLCISPKPPSSGMVTNFDILHDIIAKLVARNMQEGYVGLYDDPYLKVVVFNDEDFQFAKRVHQLHPTLDMFVSVGNTAPYEPGEIRERLLNDLEGLWNRLLADPEMNNVRALPQLHTLVWNNKRSV